MDHATKKKVVEVVTRENKNLWRSRLDKKYMYVYIFVYEESKNNVKNVNVNV